MLVGCCPSERSVFSVVIVVSGCKAALPPYAGTGRRRRWCGVRCRRKAEAMAASYRRGVLGVLAEQLRAFGYPDHGDKTDAWSRLLDDFEKSR